jgi:SAM-dependent methyltransferase
MNETSKTRRIWTDLERGWLTGTGIDIGCGPDPVFPDVRLFDLGDGDANRITKYVSDTFDFVYSSHCLEHMHDPPRALAEWWKLVKPGGVMMVIVPDEDLYEQGVFPSRFNSDHKATFTIAKSRSWSPKSHNVLDLARTLPDSELLDIRLQDVGYDRSLMTAGERPLRPVFRFAHRVAWFCERRFGWRPWPLDRLIALLGPIDQTLRPDALAQIQCCVRKRRS